MATDWQALLDSYVEALQLLSAGAQEYYVGSRRLRYVDLPEVRKTIDWLEVKVDATTAGPVQTNLSCYRRNP